MYTQQSSYIHLFIQWQPIIVSMFNGKVNRSETMYKLL